MSKDEALELALEALKKTGNIAGFAHEREQAAITAIKQALEQPEERYTHGTPLLDAFTEPAPVQEPWPEEPAGHKAGGVQPPVQDMPKIGCVNHDYDRCKAAAQPDIVKRAEEAFEAAAQRQWVGLTDEEFEDIELGCRSTPFGKIEAMKKVEAKLKERT